MTELQEFKEAQIKALQSKVEELMEDNKNLNSDMNLHLSTLESIIKDLEAELKIENENKRRIVTDLQMDIDELVDVIKGLDPTNPILQHLTL